MVRKRMMKAEKEKTRQETESDKQEERLIVISSSTKTRMTHNDDMPRKHNKKLSLCVHGSACM